jgi:hypothetical protein
VGAGEARNEVALQGQRRRQRPLHGLKIQPVCGLEHPIVLDKEGRVLDGRNRLAACRLAGVEPKFTIYEGDDPDGYALDVNIARRHMKPGARHLVMEMARRKRNESSKIATSKKDVAKQAGVDQMRLSEASLVIDLSLDGDLVRDVLSGDKNLQAAAEVARARKRAKEEREAKITRLKKDGPDLAKLVGDDAMDVDEAVAALEMRERKASEEAERQACEIRIRAERRAGELLRDIEKAVGNQHTKAASPHDGKKQTKGEQISALGVSAKQAENWQKLAAVPEETFEQELAQQERPTTSGIIRAAEPPKTNPVRPDALWLWGTLRDFEREGILDSEPTTVLQKAVGGRPSAKTGNTKGPVSNVPLSDLGISKKQSSNWQRLASVPQEIFDDELKLTNQVIPRRNSLSESRKTVFAK